MPKNLSQTLLEEIRGLSSGKHYFARNFDTPDCSIVMNYCMTDPKHIILVENGDAIAKIAIPDKEPSNISDISIVEGELTEEQRKETLKALLHTEMGSSAWEMFHYVSRPNNMIKVKW